MSRARILADYVSSGDELADKLSLSGGAMTGAITTNSTFDGVDVATRDAILTSTTTTAGAALTSATAASTYAPLAGPTFSGVTTAASLVLTPTDTPPASTTGGVYYDTSEKSLKHYDGTSWLPIAATQAIGGTPSTYSGYKVHTYTADANFTISGGSLTLDILIVAGGGSGGGSTDGHVAGGGGAGGMLVVSGLVVASGTYSIVVGSPGAVNTGVNEGSQGGTSSTNIAGASTAAIGGGHGGLAQNSTSGTHTGGDGGSGGGAGSSDSQGYWGGGSAVPSGQGNAGGTSGPGGNGKGGAGGGAGGAGSSENLGASNAAGGTGVANAFQTGVDQQYSRGGGINTSTHDAGVYGRGGNGGYNTDGHIGIQGIVIIRYVN